jgi:short-subunit dehydrogenase
VQSERALITGASSGIGLHLAREFAKHGHPLVLVAPVDSELRTIAADLAQEHGIDVHVIAKDLEQESAAQEIYDELEHHVVDVHILVNNAGHGFLGKSWEIPIERDISMLRLNIEAPLRLTKLFIPANAAARARPDFKHRLSRRLRARTIAECLSLDESVPRLVE